MVRIRLRRIGAKKKPFYRIVIADQRQSRNGRFIETIGTYDPTLEPPAVKIDAERVKYWLGNGAQPSETAHKLLAKQGLMANPVWSTVSKKSAEAPAENRGSY